VRPDVKERRVPFVDLLAQQFPEFGGPKQATHFASHSWGSLFVDLVAAFADLDDEDAIWICCFAMTQDAERLELVDNDEVFAESLRRKDTAHVLVCDKPMHALTRMWVLFELLRSVQFGKTLYLRPLKALKNMAGNSQCSIQMSKCGCAREHDKIYIEGEMEKIGGVKALNSRVRQGLVGAFQLGMQEASNVKSGGEEGVARMRALLGSVYAEQGQHKEAVVELQGVLQTATRLWHGERPHTISQVDMTDWRLFLAQALSSAGNDTEAVEQMRIAIREEEKCTAQRAGNNILLLYNTLRRSGKFVEAGNELVKAEDALRKLRDLVASGGTGVGSSADSIEAELHLKVGQQLSHYEWRHAEAEIEFRAAYKLRVNLLGADHVHSALALYNLAHALRRTHCVVEAEKIYREVLAVQVQHCDPQHLDVLNTRMNLAIDLGHQGKFAAARQELEDVVKLHRAKNPDHPKLAIALVCLGDVHRYECQWKSAQENYHAALAIYNHAKNFEHPNEIAWACVSLALSHFPGMELDAAEVHLQRALEKNVELFGKAHVAVAQVLAHQGTLQRLRGNFDAAREVYARAMDIYEHAKDHHAEGYHWIRQHMKLCEQRSKAFLCTAVEAVAKCGGLDDATAIDWATLFDKAVEL